MLKQLLVLQIYVLIYIFNANTAHRIPSIIYFSISEWFLYPNISKSRLLLDAEWRKWHIWFHYVDLGYTKTFQTRSNPKIFQFFPQIHTVKTCSQCKAFCEDSMGGRWWLYTFFHLYFQFCIVLGHFISFFWH